MPIIPRGAENVRMNPSSPVPIGSTESYRAQGEAIAGVGDAVFKVGKSLYETDRRLKLEEAVNELQNVPELADKDALQTASPDGSDYGQKFLESSQPRVNEIKNKYASADPWISKRLDSYIARADQDIGTMVTIKQTKMMESHNFSRLDKLGNESANRLRENASPNMISAELRNHNALLTDLPVSPENREKLRTAYNQKAAGQLLQGFENRQQFGKALAFLQANQEDPDMFTKLDPETAQKLGFLTPDEAKSMASQGKTYDVPVLTKGDKIKLSPEEATIMGGLNPQQKAQWIDQMKAKIRQNTEMRLGDLNANINGFEKVALAGQPLNDGDVVKLKEQINSNPNMTPSARVRAMDAVNSAYAINKQLQLVSATPRAQWDQIVSGADKKIELAAASAAQVDPKMGMAGQDFAVQADRLQKKEVLERSLEGVRKQQDADAALFVLHNDQQLQTLYKGTKDGNPEGTREFVQASLIKQQYLGIPSDKQRALMKAEALSMAATIKAMPDAYSTNEYLTQLQGQYGDYFPRVLTEIAGNDDDLAEMRAVAYAPPETRVALVDAIKNKDAISKNLKADESLTSKSSRVDIAVTGTMSAFRTATLGSANDSARLETVNALQKMVSLQAKRDLMRNPEGDAEKIAQKAYNDVVGATYAITNGGKSSAIVPRQINGRQMDTKIVGTYMDVYSKAENFGDLNVAVPTAQKGRDTKVLGESGLLKTVTVEARDIHYKNLAASHRWVTNESQTGIRLMQIQMDGNLRSVYNTLGKPVEKTYDEINMYPGKKVIDANKNFMQELFGG